MYIGLYIETLPWMCQPLVWRMVPIRRAQCMNSLSVEFTSERPEHQLPEGISDSSAGGGVKQDRCAGLSEVCMYVYTHIYIYVYRLVYKDSALDVPPSCVSHGAHQARSVHKQTLFRIHQRTLRAPASGEYLRQVCMYMYTHTHIYTDM